MKSARLPAACAATLLVITLLLMSWATTARGQSALDGFDPNANGPIRVVAVQADGKILIGGDFTTVAPNGGAVVMRNRIARLRRPTRPTSAPTTILTATSTAVTPSSCATAPVSPFRRICFLAKSSGRLNEAKSVLATSPCAGADSVLPQPR